LQQHPLSQKGTNVENELPDQRGKPDQL